MIERVSSNGFVRDSNRRFDRALGAAATLGLGTYFFQILIRYLWRRHNEEIYYWLEELIGWLKNSSNKEQGLSDKEALHHGSCHCRSVLFEFRGPDKIIAKDGNGKIHYPHITVTSSDVRIVAGGEILKMYYVSVPASGSKDGIEPETAAFTFCSRCGVHVLHAPSALSNALDVNVECLESSICWSLSKVKQNLSQGVPALSPWNHCISVRHNDLDNHIPIEFFAPASSTLGSRNHDDLHSIQENWTLPTPKSVKSEVTLVSPGTPSTSSTSGTESHLLFNPQRSGRDDFGNGDSDQAGGCPPYLKLPPSIRSHAPQPILTSLSTSSEKVESIATPEMRDKLNFYIGKHVNMSPSSNTIATPKIVNAIRSTDANDEAMLSS